MPRYLPINISDLTTPLQRVQTPPTGAKIYQDSRQCFSTKVVYDRPGTYTFSMPTTATCAKVVLVGGGGKPLCNANLCCSWAGAGGAYSEKFFSNPAGATFTIVVGAQQGSSSASCNGVAQHTAGGATFCTPGVATGGDFNSAGGCAGCTMQLAPPTGLGSCVCLTCSSICGYCVVFAYKDSPNGGSTCCNTLLAGGGSAGSPFDTQGGNGWSVCGNCWSAVAGGGGGIGQCNCVTYFYNCCNCIYQQADGNAPSQCVFFTCFPASASGGGGTLAGCSCDALGSPRSFTGTCAFPIHQPGDGGKGGPNASDGQGFIYYHGCRGRVNPSYNSVCCFAYVCTERYKNDPVRVCWWDMCEICGSGSSGFVNENHYVNTTYSNVYQNRPSNSGEGAGTGGVMTFWCQPQFFFGLPPTGACSMINWTLVCTLGVTGQCNLAFKAIDKLVPQHLTCAGTLGGSGGVGWLGYDSRAGYGGGGGQVKCAVVCVCHGGLFNCCNSSAAAPALAFPPSCLDMLVSNAGTGLAIIYYRED